MRQLAAEADRIAAPRTKPTAGSRRRQRAALDTICEKVGYHVAWARWSASADEIAALIDRIVLHPARGIDDKLVKFDALRWSLLDDGAVFDTAVRRQVVAFRRDLVALAGSR
ncbi:MAG: hypothetical protein HY834_19795 [Devosia nanyangense]|uniref:Uncharacterized protein n=1 Tax=Devosia nanyangense TaxID=1228055 RepID=A0A933L4W7_9HYPH|nr:hypothetical protein [Devosia nanyangense]